MTSPQTYGVPTTGHTAESPALTELRRQGYTVLPDLLSATQLTEARERLDRVYAEQEKEFGRDALAAIHELHVARLPLAYDDWFLALANHPAVLDLVRQCLGSFVVLHLQNGILNMPGQVHHQSAWHRDLPYQEWTISKPLALSALFCLDPFTLETGSTHVLPYSHKFESLPPMDHVERHAAIAAAAAGSVIIFDCMLFHRAGHNTSASIRRGVNHVYSIPLLNMQIDIPRTLQGKHSDQDSLAQLLGYSSQVPATVLEWRRARQGRSKSRQ
jgi:ectoine hydroxylase-related dioxygenase (phytanoyl-CoA dioxygenase family)